MFAKSLISCVSVKTGHMLFWFFLSSFALKMKKDLSEIASGWSGKTWEGKNGITSRRCRENPICDLLALRLI